MPTDVTTDAATSLSEQNLQIALAYIRAIADGGPEDFAAYCADDVEFVEMPNRISPQGSRRDRATAIASAHRGRALMSAQTYDIVSSIAVDDRVVLELAWSGTLAIQLQHLAPGSKMIGYMSIFLELREGKIWRQRNYDCYPPF